jgi:hypothetical protein
MSHDKSWIPLDQLMPLDLHVGMPIMSRWKMGPQYHPGQITSVEGKRVHVRYDDGDAEWTTTATLAIPIQPPPDASPRASRIQPAHGAPLPGGEPKRFSLPAIMGSLGAVLVGLAFLFGKYGCR